MLNVFPLYVRRLIERVSARKGIQSHDLLKFQDSDSTAVGINNKI